MRAGTDPNGLSTRLPSRRRPRSAAHVGGADPIGGRAPYVPCTAQNRHLFGGAGTARRWRAPTRAGTVPNCLFTRFTGRGRTRSAAHVGGAGPISGSRLVTVPTPPPPPPSCARAVFSEGAPKHADTNDHKCSRHQQDGFTKTKKKCSSNGPQGVARRRASWRFDEQNSVDDHLNHSRNSCERQNISKYVRNPTATQN
jgi:hypothetical protein